MLNITFGKSYINKTSVYKWYKHFQEGREDVEDDDALDAPPYQQPMITSRKRRK